MLNNQNLLGTNHNSLTWDDGRILTIFLSYSSDCKDICQSISSYLTGDMNAALKKYGLNIYPIMYENSHPSSENGGALESSLKDIDSSSILFAFFYKKHGAIIKEEIKHALHLQSKNSIYDICIFFKKLKCYDEIFNPRRAKKIVELKKNLMGTLTYKEYSEEVEVIKKVSQIIIKIICDTKLNEDTTIAVESLGSRAGIAE